MKDLIIEGTENTPKIICTYLPGKVEVLGRSIPENATAFYAPVVSWLKEFSAVSRNKIELVFHLDYINSMSQKMIIDLMLYVQELHKQGREVIINWFYDPDDEEMLEEGSIFKEKLDVKVNIVPADI